MPTLVRNVKTVQTRPHPCEVVILGIVQMETPTDHIHDQKVVTDYHPSYGKDMLKFDKPVLALISLRVGHLESLSQEKCIL